MQLRWTRTPPRAAAIMPCPAWNGCAKAHGFFSRPPRLYLSPDEEAASYFNATLSISSCIAIPVQGKITACGRRSRRRVGRYVRPGLFSPTTTRATRSTIRSSSSPAELLPLDGDCPSSARTSPYALPCATSRPIGGRHTTTSASPAGHDSRRDSSRCRRRRHAQTGPRYRQQLLGSDALRLGRHECHGAVLRRDARHGRG